MSFFDFETFINESAGFAFQDELNLYGTSMNLTFYNEPTKFSNVTGATGKLFYDLKPTVKKSGIEDFQVTKATFVLDFENEIVQFTTSYPKVEFQKLPFFIQGVEIDMKKSDNPKNWEVSIEIGSRD
jgi:hypothetical protein